MRILTLMALSQVAFANPLAAQSAGRDTAKTHLAAAINAAKQWHSDAELWLVSAGSFIRFSGDLESCDPNIPASGWTYFFRLPQNVGSEVTVGFKVMVCRGQLVAEGIGAVSMSSPAISDTTFLDTDHIGKIVRGVLRHRKCDRRPKVWGASLRATSTSQSVWSATVACGDFTELLIAVDAKRGVVLKTQLTRDEP